MAGYRVELQAADGGVVAWIEVPNSVHHMPYLVWNRGVYALRHPNEAPRSWESQAPIYRQVFAWWAPEGR